MAQTGLDSLLLHQPLAESMPQRRNSLFRTSSDKSGDWSVPKGISTVLLIVAFAMSDSSACADSDLNDFNLRMKNGQETRVVCFGDSITGIYYHSGGQRAWCDMLGIALQKANPQASLRMINAGISGHTTVQALARIDKDVIAIKPHLVVVMFGMNDVTRVPIRDFQNNLKQISQRCLQVGSDVVLCTPNSVIENTARPNQKLAEYSMAVRAVAGELELPVVDFFEDWTDFRRKDPTAWSLLMSDAIHPNMTGHVRFAESIAQVICGREVSLQNAAAPYDALHHTFDLLQRNQPVSVIAMSPWDEWLPELLREHFPSASFDVTKWPTSGRSVTQLAEWARRIRGLKPDLVVPAVPASVSAQNPENFIRDYEWVLNHSFQFAGRPWDVVPIAPSVDAQLSAQNPQYLELAQKIIVGKDVRHIDRPSEDRRSPRELAAAWILEQKQIWQGATFRLPDRNAAVYVPAQSWPHHPGPRSVRVSVHYPGSALEHVNQNTGIMLTLHNWGGEGCAGTANPDALAARLNVIAVCVDYLQSGRPAAVESPLPYDYGYLQAIDALRALSWVRNGLKLAGRQYDDGRMFCTGGSGGGNVTLMANKLAPRTFACVVDMCGMKKLTDDIAFGLPGASGLNARWSRDADSVNLLTADHQAIRFAGHPEHLAAMKQLSPTSRIVVVHGQDDVTCPFQDAQEFVANLEAAGLDVESHFVADSDVDGKVFTSSGHALGNRTEIVFQVAEQYLNPESPQALRRIGPCDFDRGEEIRYSTDNGQFVVSFKDTYPRIDFRPDPHR